MACDLYYSGSSVKDELERVQDPRQEGFCRMKAGKDQDLNLSSSTGEVGVESKKFDRIWQQINWETLG